MQIRIGADGGVFGSTIQDDNFKAVEGVKSVTWRHEAGDVPRAEVELLFVPLLTACQARMFGPGGKEVRRIEYADGSFDDFPAD